MATSTTNKERFRLVTQAKHLCISFAEMQGAADRRYRGTVCEEMRQWSQSVLYSIWSANGLPAGSPERLELQMQADKLLEKMKLNVSVEGSLVNCGVKKEAEIELAVESLIGALHNWMKSDLKTSTAAYEKQIRNQFYETEKAKKTVGLLKGYIQSGTEASKDTNVAVAYNEALSDYRIASERYKELIRKYDVIRTRYLKLKEKDDKDTSALAAVLGSGDFRKFAAEWKK